MGHDQTTVLVLRDGDAPRQPRYRRVGLPHLSSGVESVEVTGGPLGDTFAVAADAFTAFNIHGGNPAAAPGDRLAVSGTTTAFLTATAAGTFAGTYDFTAGSQDVTFDSLETMDVGADAVSITKDDGSATAVPSTAVTYTVVVTNNSTVGLTGIQVADLFPITLTNISWTVAYAGTESTGAPHGTGDIGETIRLATAERPRTRARRRSRRTPRTARWPTRPPPSPRPAGWNRRRATKRPPTPTP